MTFVECPSDLNGMIDAAKYADLVLLLIDGSFGFEMETFEFLNLLQVWNRKSGRREGCENCFFSFDQQWHYSSIESQTLLPQVHGFPKVMGVLTHLDGFTDQKRLKKTKKKLKVGPCHRCTSSIAKSLLPKPTSESHCMHAHASQTRFWTEIYDGAKLFYLSGIQHGAVCERCLSCCWSFSGPGGLTCQG